MSNLIHGDCIEELKKLPDNSVDAIITDPPYGLEFMGKDWDKFKEGKNIAGGTTGEGTPFGRSKAMPSFYQLAKGRMKDYSSTTINKVSIPGTGFTQLPQLNKKLNPKCKICGHYRFSGTPCKCETPEYEIENSFMQTFQEFTTNWASECLRVLKPGAYLLSFGGTRTYHRMACGIEDAGFEIRDTIGWVYGCVPEETQILTKKGWMNYTSLKKGEHIFSFNPLDNRIDSDEVQEIYEYGYKGEMVKLKNDNTEQLLTPNHRVYLKEGFRKQNNYERRCYLPENWSWKYAEQIKNYGQYILPLGAIYEGYLSVGTDFAELLGWILSEGNFQGNAINIYQSDVNLNKVLIIKNILDRLKIKYSHYQRKKKYKERYYTEHQFYFSGDIVDRIKEWIPNKKPTYELLNLKYNEKIALFNSLMLGDGSKKNGEEYITFYQNDLNFLEWFQTLCHLIGKQARINKNKMCVEVHHNPNTQLQSNHLKKRKSMYSGIVWCPKTKNGTWIARYKGRIFITGNSGFPKSLNIGKQIDKMQGNKREVVGKQNYSMPKADNTIQASSYGISGGSLKNGVTAERIIPNITKGNSEWEGWGTALKPAWESICVARKPLSEKNVALNVLKWGTGGINIDECRIGTEQHRVNVNNFTNQHGNKFGNNMPIAKLGERMVIGRFPANIILECTCDRLEEGKAKGSQGHWSKTKTTGFGEFGNGKSEYFGVGEKDDMKCVVHTNLNCPCYMLDEQSGIKKGEIGRFGRKDAGNYNATSYKVGVVTDYGVKDIGGASRFFYCAKASKSERNNGCEELPDIEKHGHYAQDEWSRNNMGNTPDNKREPTKNNHPTVKPVALMEYLIKLVSRENAIVLDPFLGSGTTAIACLKLNRRFIGIEKEPDYVKIAEARIKPYLEQRKLLLEEKQDD